MAFNITTGYPNMQGNAEQQISSLNVTLRSLIDELAYIVPNMDGRINSQLQSAISGGGSSEEESGV